MNTERTNDFSKYSRPRLLSGYTVIISSGCGKLHVTVNFDGPRPIEVYIATSTKGGCAANANVIGRLISRALQLGLPISEILEQLHSTKCSTAISSASTKLVLDELDGQKVYVKSCADGIGWAIETAMNMRGTK